MGLTHYVVSFRNDRDGTWVRIGTARTLADAATMRRVSGDLVFRDGIIVDDPSWLFDWEREEENCYAKRMIAQSPTLDFSKETPPLTRWGW